MAIIDLVIIGLSLGFVVICWINSRDGNAITTASRSQIRETKLPGIDDLSIMDRIAKKSEPAVASASVTQHETVTDEEVAEEDASNEIPEFDDVKSDEPKMTKLECPNC